MAKKASSSANATVDTAPAAASTSDGIEVSALHLDAAKFDDNKYTVVARRYRPKTFEELVGQDTVAQALKRAIDTHRVGHAYLFTGARGVGKTSTARIFAKALNASTDNSGHFDPNSEMSLAIDSGEDMDVLEIDGASNRGIDEVRQLRANAAVRPSRSRYKIYIIDEVHMLTTQAFNALLKTLEEPPAHVKFIFCTTDPEKIPITVLSRCQRFDFPPVHTEQILDRLKFICDQEGMKADDAGLRLIARRAAGSMRDSQSLLEQLLSFGGNEITVDSVHALLGTADESRLAAFVTRLIERDAAGALLELDAASAAGVDVGQLAEQLLGYLRDIMTVSVGGSVELLRTANPNSLEQLRDWGKAWGTMTLLSALQLLDETIVRMRHSVQGRILLEIALVQICNLQDLQALSELVKAFSQGQPPAIARNPGSAASATAKPLAAQPVAAVSKPGASEVKKKAELSEVLVDEASVPTAAPVSSIVAPAKSTDHDIASINQSLNDESSSNAESMIAETAIMEEPNDRSLNDSQIATIALSDSDSRSVSKTYTVSEPTADSQQSAAPPTPTDASPLELFQMAAAQLEGLAGQAAAMAVEALIVKEDRWRVGLSQDGAFALIYFQTPENLRRICNALKDRLQQADRIRSSQATGELQIEFYLTNKASPDANKFAMPAPTVPEDRPVVSVPQAQRIRAAMTNPLIKQFMEIFDGSVVRVDSPANEVSKPAMLESDRIASTTGVNDS